MVEGYKLSELEHCVEEARQGESYLLLVSSIMLLNPLVRAPSYSVIDGDFDVSCLSLPGPLAPRVGHFHIVSVHGAIVASYSVSILPVALPVDIHRQGIQRRVSCVGRYGRRAYGCALEIRSEHQTVVDSGVIVFPILFLWQSPVGEHALYTRI